MSSLSSAGRGWTRVRRKYLVVFVDKCEGAQILGWAKSGHVCRGNWNFVKSHLHPPSKPVVGVTVL